MQITILTTLTSFVALASAGCYSSGSTFPNRDEALSFVHDACYNNGGMFTGQYSPGQTKSMCPHSKYSGNANVKFEVENQNKNAGFDLGDDDCVKRLYSEIDSCSWGGESSYSGGRFK